MRRGDSIRRGAIVHVVFSLDMGGMENGVINLTHALRARGRDIRVICLERPGAMAERLPSATPLVALQREPGFRWSTVQRLAAQLRQWRPGVLHSHNLGPLLYTALAMGLGPSPIRLLHGEHAELTAKDLRPVHRWLRFALYRRCAAVHTVSGGQTAQLRAEGLAVGRLLTLVNGVDTQRFAPQPQVREAVRQQLGLPTGARLLGVLGRYGPYKGHERLLAVWAQLAASFPEVHWVFVGAGGERETAVRALAAQHPAADRLHLVGYQAQPERWYTALDALVAPSLNEGMSNAVLEAMASGLPVLAHAHCGANELLVPGVSGWLAALESEAGLANALQELLAKPIEQWQAVGAAARQRALREFSLAGMVDRYDAVYASLLPAPESLSVEAR